MGAASVKPQTLKVEIRLPKDDAGNFTQSQNDIMDATLEIRRLHNTMGLEPELINKRI